jgi:hypothetical protein
MRKWTLLFALLTMLVSTQAIAGHVMTTAYDYGKLEIPHWMQGPIWVSFSHDGFDYTVVHVFENKKYQEPYILLVQDRNANYNNDSDRLRLMYNLIINRWSADGASPCYSLDEFIFTDRDNDICCDIRLESHYTERSETFYRDLLGLVGLNFYEDFDNTQFKVYLKGDLPGWIKDCAPFKIQEGS